MPLLAAAFVLFYFCPVNETQVTGRTRLILLPYLTDEWEKFFDRGRSFIRTALVSPSEKLVRSGAFLEKVDSRCLFLPQ